MDSLGTLVARPMVVRAGESTYSRLVFYGPDGEPVSMLGHTFAGVFCRADYNSPLVDPVAGILAPDGTYIDIPRFSDVSTAVFEAGASVAVRFFIMQTTGNANYPILTREVKVLPGPVIDGDAPIILDRVPAEQIEIRGDQVVVSFLGAAADPRPALEAAETANDAAANANGVRVQMEERLAQVGDISEAVDQTAFYAQQTAAVVTKGTRSVPMFDMFLALTLAANSTIVSARTVFGPPIGEARIASQYPIARAPARTVVPFDMFREATFDTKAGIHGAVTLDARPLGNRKPSASGTRTVPPYDMLAEVKHDKAGGIHSGLTMLGVGLGKQADGGSNIGTEPVTDIGAVVQRDVVDTATGIAIPQLQVRRSGAVFTKVTYGPFAASLVSSTSGAAIAYHQGTLKTFKWRMVPVGAATRTYPRRYLIVVFLGQSFTQGHTDTAAEPVPPWRGNVHERAWMFDSSAYDGIDRGPRVLQVAPLAGNKGVVVDSVQFAKRVPLHGSTHAGDGNRAQTAAETCAAALLGQHLHHEDQVHCVVIGTGSTPSADFMPTTAHYQSVQKAIDAGADFVARQNAVVGNSTASQFTADTTLGSNVLTNVSSTAGLARGQTIAHANIPADSYVYEISGNTVTFAVRGKVPGALDAVATGNQVTATISARLTPMVLEVIVVPQQGEQDNEDNVPQATFVANWTATGSGLSAYTTLKGGTWRGLLFNQCHKNNQGTDPWMATKAQAQMVRSGVAKAIAMYPMLPGASGNDHLFPLTYLPLGSADAYAIAEILAGNNPSVYVADDGAVLTSPTTTEVTITGGVAPFQFDTTTIPAAPDGNYGLAMADDNGTVAISAVAFTGGRKLLLTHAATSKALHARLRPALTGTNQLPTATGPRTNIRDASAWPCGATAQIISGWLLGGETPLV